LTGKKVIMKNYSISIQICSLVLLMGIALPACYDKQLLPLMVCEMRGHCQKIAIGPGPEDFVMDSRQSPARLLVSSYERRTPAANGDICFYVPTTGETGIMTRTGEPERLTAFKPHGVDIRHTPQNTYLYVILHDPYGNGERRENAVGVYRVLADRLEMVRMLEDAEHLWSPNDLSVLDNGDLYLTNDYRGKLDLYFKRKASEIAFYDSDTEDWQIVADDLAFANGILAESDRVFVTTTLGNQLLSFSRNTDGSLGKCQPVVELKGGDNLTRYGEHLIAAAHFDDYAFVRHARNGENMAPTVVMRITPETGRKKAIYVDEGAFISAASTALIHEGKIYISQIFDPFMVVCDAPPDVNW